MGADNNPLNQNPTTASANIPNKEAVQKPKSNPIKLIFKILAIVILLPVGALFTYNLAKNIYYDNFATSEKKAKRILEEIKTVRKEQAVPKLPDSQAEFDAMKKAAEKGDPKAQYRLAKCYLEGSLWIVDDKNRAFEWLNKSAQQGFVKAQYELANIYLFNSDGFPIHERKGIEWLTKVAKYGNTQAQRELADYYSDGGDKKANEWYMKVFKLHAKAAEQGDANAQYELARCYANGWGIAKDDTKAIKWLTKSFNSYLKAAEQGDANAQYELSRYYECGWGIAEDDTKANEWRVKAADQGHIDAQFKLASYYSLYDDGKKDIKKAITLYTKAAEQGNKEAQRKLSWCYERSNEKDEAIVWMTKVAEQGDLQAQRKLAELYCMDGKHKSIYKAIEWYTKAINQKDAYPPEYSSYNTYYISEDGIKWEAEYAKRVQCLLADCYMENRDYKKAVEWYTKMARQGYQEGQVGLARCYAKGNGVIEDYVESYKWYLLASANEIEKMLKPSEIKDLNDEKERLTKKMTKEQISEAQKKAKKIFDKK